MHSRRVLLVPLLLLVASWLSTAPVAGTEPKLHPDAPPEMAQFGFLVGSFECKTRQLTANGDYVEGTGRWTGRFTLDGFAFEDDWVSTSLRGTTWRTFDPAKKRWVNRWLAAGVETPPGFTGNLFFGGWTDDKMVLKAEGEDLRGAYLDNIEFKNITDDGFLWTMDRSYDGGETWTRAVMIVEARRAK